MKKEEAEQYLDRFPKLSAKAKREAERTLQTYILYDNKGNGRCSYCENDVKVPVLSQKQMRIVDSSARSRLTPHRKTQICPKCGQEAVTINYLNNFNGTTVESLSNVAVFLNKRGDDNLYIRCYKLELCFLHGKNKPQITWTELKRYIFTPNGEAEYMLYYDYKAGGYEWRTMSRVSEPYFANWSFYSYGCRYQIVNMQAIEKTFYRHSELRTFMNATGQRNNIIKYLKFYRRHTGAERLIKCGLAAIVNSCMDSAKNSRLVDWKKSELLKMLKLNKSELNVIKSIGDFGGKYFKYLRAREMFPTIPIEMRIAYYDSVGDFYISRVSDILDKPKIDVAKYLIKNKIRSIDYRDYIDNCRKLGYDLTSNIIVFPPHFGQAHDRAASAAFAFMNKNKQDKLEELYARREILCKDFGKYKIIQPKSVEDIIREGRLQEHCVGGYAERHCDGKLTILFLRKKSDIDKPFYTMEISNELKIVQCRGYRNDCGKEIPKEVVKIEREYEEYLKSILPKWRKGIKKQGKQERIGA